MKLTTRHGPGFLDIRVDEIETTVYKVDKDVVESMIFNLLDVADILTGYTNKPIQDYVKELYY